MRPKGTKAELEARRRWGVALLEQGHGVCEVARLVGVGSGSVSRWKAMYQRAGEEGLKAKPHPGAKPKLSESQRKQLAKLLLRGTQAAGFRTDLWTCSRVAQLIEKRFGVRYHPDHVCRLLHRLGWSCQKPERRARERDEAAIARWRKADWPRIKKSPQKAS